MVGKWIANPYKPQRRTLNTDNKFYKKKTLGPGPPIIRDLVLLSCVCVYLYT